MSNDGFWFINNAILILVGGALAAAGFIVSHRPDAKAALDKLVPYQATIGVILLVLGLWVLLKVLSHNDELSAVSKLGGKFKLWVFLSFATPIVEILLGVLLGFGLVASRLGNASPELAKKGEELRGTLVKFQVPIGLAAILVSLLWLFLKVSPPKLV